ncbi:GNAT family N-acetyltransferase [Fusibacter sp. 3D3]|uniref:GNAT family N-acetyltransferase n=1 Tax=Fusibacter sp. 3D3 TaxID=1048380 RepID=UPI0008533AF6|nr:GNAT family N-acetyltransferase [Fusibacter sp. 3D3]GAU75424.1 GCN5-related N-acetyltransferase [Fusibacter sp. 3D3]
MAIQFRNYTTEVGITGDNFKVRSFLLQLGYSEFSYARWDWMTTHSYLDKNAVGKIGLWEDEDRLVGIATFDTRLGSTYCLAFPNYAYLKKDMLIYAKEHLTGSGEFGVVISSNDLAFQDIAASLGFTATMDKEEDAIFYFDKTSVEYQLPNGFHITTMKETYDAYEYLRVLWKGFNHELNGEGNFTFTDEKNQGVHAEMKRPNVDLNLKVAVVGPDGHFVSYCGMWYDEKAGFAVIEPVATDPEYRRMGLGKAAVFEGIRRVGELGAKNVLVGSSQQFYYSIGMRPFAVASVWKLLA